MHWPAVTFPIIATHICTLHTLIDTRRTPTPHALEGQKNNGPNLSPTSRQALFCYASRYHYGHSAHHLDFQTCHLHIVGGADRWFVILESHLLALTNSNAKHHDRAEHVDLWLTKRYLRVGVKFRICPKGR